MLLVFVYDWVDVIVGYDDFMDVVCFVDVVVYFNGILVKEIVFIEVFVFFDYFICYKFYFKEGQLVVVFMVVLYFMGFFEVLVLCYKGDICFCFDKVESMKGILYVYEFVWNYMMLCVLKIDLSIIYFQV